MILIRKYKNRKLYRVNGAYGRGDKGHLDLPDILELFKGTEEFEIKDWKGNVITDEIVAKAILQTLPRDPNLKKLILNYWST